MKQENEFKLPDWEDADPDGCIEIICDSDPEVQDFYPEHLKYIHVSHYRTSGLTGKPWRRTKYWMPHLPESGEYGESDFAWALSLILKNVHTTYDLQNLSIYLSDEVSGKILLMKEQAEAKAKPPTYPSEGIVE